MVFRLHHIAALQLLLIAGTFLHAQEAGISFDRITINDGLSLSSVYAIHQDRTGFLWFGTEDGLNKYDGSEFQIYNALPGNLNSLSHKWIEFIAEDKNGAIWTGSRHGVTVIDPSTDEMRQFIHAPDSLESLSNDTVTALMVTADHLWVGTRKGLNRIDLNTQWNKRIPTDTSIASQQINTLHADSDGMIWIGTNGGLFLYRPERNVVQNITRVTAGGNPMMVRSVLKESDTLWVGHEDGMMKYILEKERKSGFRYPGITYAGGVSVRSFYRDTENRLWLVTGHGLSYLEKGTVFELIEAEETTPSLAVNPVKTLIEDQNGYLWFGTFGSGIYRIRAGETGYTQLAHVPGNQNSLSDNTIHSIYLDRAGTIWIGTFGAGLSVYHPGAHIIKTLKHNAFSEQTMSGSFVWSVFEDRQGKVWIGTNSNGIDLYDPATETFINYPCDADQDGSLPPFGIRKIYQSANGTIWIGSDGGGLCKLDPATGNYKQYLSEPGNPATISHNSVRTIFEDSTGILWIGTRHGLNRFYPERETFVRYLHDPDDPNSISNDFVYSAIHMDRRGNLWVGTYGGGLNRLDIRTGQFTAYKFDPGDPSSISDNIVFSIYEDSKGYMWIGTNSGLNLFNPGNGKFKRYGMEAGLPNEVIYGIMPDRFNRLWMTTNKGISRLDLTDFSFKNYDVRDGLQSNEFNGGAFHAGSSGKLYAGGVYGLSIIDPEKMVPRENTAELIVTKLEIMGEAVAIMPGGLMDKDQAAPGEVVAHDGRYYLGKHIPYLRSVKLDYRERFFSIEFVALNHPSPNKLNYRYRMRNLEEGWTNAGNRNYVTYANMKPGSYLLEIDAVNNDGFSAREKAALQITITPPFWHSPWFIALEVLLAIVLVIVVYRILLNQRTNRILKEQYSRIKIANEKLRESENNLKELNATKDKFFSIISHDLKNPFASVLSISELINENFEMTDRDELRHGVKKIHQTNKYIYNLLENLLTWSKSQRGKLAVSPGKFNLSRIIETNINILKLDAERKNIELKAQYNRELSGFADMEMISTAFRNLLNNAIKFTHPGKSVTISAREREDRIEVAIQDEGVGIGKEHLDKLFSIEEKFRSEGTAGEKGTGLGLIICKEFIERNSGILEVESQPGKGSTFTFSVPLAMAEAHQ